MQTMNVPHQTPDPLSTMDEALDAFNPFYHPISDAKQERARRAMNAEDQIRAISQERRARHDW